MEFMGFVSIPSFDDQTDTDHYKEGEGQHFQCRMFMDKTRDLWTEQEHDDHGNNNCGYHDLHMLGRSTGCNDTVKRKYRIDQCDLHKGLAECYPFFILQCLIGIFAFQL